MSRLRLSLARIPNLTRDEVPVGKSEADNVAVKTWGEQSQLRLRPEAALGDRRGPRHSRPGTRRQAERSTVCRLHGRRRAAGAGADQLHARPAHRRSTATPKCCRRSWSTPKSSSAPANCPSSPRIFFAAPTRTPKRRRGEFKDNDHWLIPTAEVPVTNLYRDEILDDARSAHLADRLHAVFPRRGRRGRQRHARHHSPAPVSKGRAGQVHAARRVRRSSTSG